MQNQTRLYVLWLYLITGGYVVFISEILSVFNIINQVSIYLSWILLIVFIFLVKRNLKLKLFSNLKYFFKSYTLKKNYFSSIIGLIILITLVICFIYPPNTDFFRKYTILEGEKSRVNKGVYGQEGEGSFDI